jgi:hypothetical protein
LPVRTANIIRFNNEATQTRRTTMIKYLALTAAFGIVASAAQAASAWPSSAVGKWTGGANEDQVTITISSQANSGECRQISGTFVDNTLNNTSDILGFYCPASGQIAFRRTATGATAAFQNYTASLSMKGRFVYMGGVFAENATAANVGEYAFYADK